jgi:hypothetical protein
MVLKWKIHSFTEKNKYFIVKRLFFSIKRRYSPFVAKSVF